MNLVLPPCLRRLLKPADDKIAALLLCPPLSAGSEGIFELVRHLDNGPEFNAEIGLACVGGVMGPTIRQILVWVFPSWHHERVPSAVRPGPRPNGATDEIARLRSNLDPALAEMVRRTWGTFGPIVWADRASHGSTDNGLMAAAWCGTRPVAVVAGRRETPENEVLRRVAEEALARGAILRRSELVTLCSLLGAVEVRALIARRTSQPGAPEALLVLEYLARIGAGALALPAEEAVAHG